ncbi:MAG: hypothetical protein RUMPE_00835 [Eubacteriales bacterium SKADARSKE-1]|nr:hypothetical protein [Eubacteriales bacterium SKADARSKE-1]
MKAIFKRKNFISFFIVVLSLSIFLFTDSSSEKVESLVLTDGAVLSDNIEVLSDHDGNFLILSSTETTSHIIYFDGNTQTISGSSLELNYKISAAAIFGGYLYIAKCVNNNSNYTTIITKYSFYNGSFTFCGQYSLSSTKVENFHSLAATENNFIFFINENNRNQIIAYNTLNDATQTLTVGTKQFASISSNFSGTKLYTITTDKTFVSFDLENSFNQCSLSSSPDDHCSFLSDNLLISSTNAVYNLDSTNVSNLFSINNSGSYNSSCLFGDYLLGEVSDNTIYCYDIPSKTATKKITIDGTLLALSTSGNVTIAILKKDSNKSLQVINTSDLTDISTNPSGGNEEPALNISSTSYTINFNSKTISNVPLSTTIAVFKDNIENPNNYSISFTNYLGKSFSSGTLGTGSTVSFSNSSGDITAFKIIINGDITGEGNENSRDEDYMYNYLFGKTSLVDEYLTAADINGDGKVNTIDLLIMYKNLNS